MIPPETVHSDTSSSTTPVDSSSSNNNDIIIKSLQEVKVCEYEITVCVPFMCTTELSKENTKNDFDNKLIAAMTTLRPTCLLHNEGWWTFEACFNKVVLLLNVRYFYLFIRLCKYSIIFSVYDLLLLITST